MDAGAVFISTFLNTGRCKVLTMCCHSPGEGDSSTTLSNVTEKQTNKQMMMLITIRSIFLSITLINIERFLPAMLCKRGLCRRTVSVRPSVHHVRIFSGNE